MLERVYNKSKEIGRVGGNSDSDYIDHAQSFTDTVEKIRNTERRTKLKTPGFGKDSTRNKKIMFGSQDLTQTSFGGDDSSV